MSYNYVVTAQKPTAVTHVLTGRFTSPSELNLIVFKSSRIEVHTMSSDGLISKFDLSIYGRVATCKLYRPAGERTDLLFVSTERFQFFVLGYDPASDKIVTKANGDVKDRIGRVNDNGQIGVIDPANRMIGLHIYSGLFKVIPMDPKGQLKSAFNIRLEELNVIDIQFLYGCVKPTVCVLYEDTRECRHLKTYEVNLKNKDFTDGPWRKSNIDPGTTMIIPIPEPYGGVLILSMESIAYIKGSPGQQAVITAIPVRCGLIRAYSIVDTDGSRWLLADEWGSLHILVLRITDGQVSDLSMEWLGETSTASALAYLDNGVVFLGSCYGDSQLIRLCPEKDEATDSYIDVLDSYINLAPIGDFCVVDLDRQGQCQVVTCSGAYKDGSLRIIRNGIGIDEQASVELPGIKGLWSLRENSSAKFDSYLVQAFIGETRILAIQDEELGECEIASFESNMQSLYCGNMIGDVLVQVTSASINIINCSDLTLNQTWRPSDGSDSDSDVKRITVASGNANQLLIALAGGHVVLLQMINGELKEIHKTTLEHEVACVDISPFTYHSKKVVHSDDDDKMEIEETLSSSSQPAVSFIAAVGMWTDFTIRILDLSTFNTIHKEELNCDTIPRSLLFTCFEGVCYLLTGLGDGHLFTFRVNFFNLLANADVDINIVNQQNLVGNKSQPFLYERKKVNLGSQAISLSTFTSRNDMHVFAASDRPTVIYSASDGNKLLYSNVNLKELNVMTSFNSSTFPDCLALASEEELQIGTINEIQKLHIRSIMLGEHPRRMCHQESSNVFCVATVRFGQNTSRENSATNPATSSSSSLTVTPQDDDENQETDMIETNYIRLLDDATFDTLDSFQFDDFEHVCSVITCSFNSQDSGSGNATGAAGEDISGTASGPTKEYLVVGTAYAFDEEPEPSKGRIFVFEVVSSEFIAPSSSSSSAPTANNPNSTKKLNLITEKQVQGAVYTLNSFNGKLLAGINSKVQLYKYVDDGHDGKELHAECGHHGHVIALFVESRGDFIIVGDLMKSISLLVYKSLDSSIEEIATDYNSNWMTAIDIIDDNTYIGAENSYNLFTAMKNDEAVTDEESNRLLISGEYHLGEFINRFRHGSLVMQSSTSSNPSISKSRASTLLYGTVNGSVGVIAKLTKSQYQFLLCIQQALNKVVKGIGGLDHDEWRSFSNDQKTVKAKGFIDGDLVETFLILNSTEMESVVKHVKELATAAASGAKGGTSSMEIDGATSSSLGMKNIISHEDEKGDVPTEFTVDSVTKFLEDLSVQLH